MTANPAYELKQGGSSRGQILTVAEELMSERGYAGTSISMISERSGLPASSIYWHFGSKARLLDEVLEQATERLLAPLRVTDRLSGPPQQQVRELFLACVAEPGSGRAAAFRLLAMIGIERGGQSSATIRRLRHQLLSRWQRVFRELSLGLPEAEADSTAQALARFAVAAVDGISFAAQVDPDLDAPELGQVAATTFMAFASAYLSRSTDAA
jgi:AcrR family transcriptional regulator